MCKHEERCIKSNETSYVLAKMMVHNVAFWYLHGMLETIFGGISVGADLLQ